MIDWSRHARVVAEKFFMEFHCKIPACGVHPHFHPVGSVEVLAQRPLGIDVSSYQGSADSPPTNIVWTDVKNSGVSFAWAKATEGVTFNDADFIFNANNAKAAGVCIGAYHFAHPESNTPMAEANHFWNVAGGYIRGDGLSVQPVLDYETFTAPNNVPVGATSYADWANQWCNAVVSKAAAAGVVVKPIIYTSTCEAGNLDGTVAQWTPWIANPSGLSEQTGSPWSSTPCNSAGYELWGAGVWSVWQYSWTASVPGIVGAVDMDVFNGTSNQMVATLVVATNALPGVILMPQLNRVVDSGGSATFIGIGFRITAAQLSMAVQRDERARCDQRLNPHQQRANKQRRKLRARGDELCRQRHQQCGLAHRLSRSSHGFRR